MAFCKGLKAEHSQNFNKAFQKIVSDELSNVYTYGGGYGKKAFKKLKIADMLFGNYPV